tara:strand:- start:504 stop:734 length:231 start_codon:yes stop_codon:yes gene_type:complete
MSDKFLLEKRVVVTKDYGEYFKKGMKGTCTADLAGESKHPDDIFSVWFDEKVYDYNWHTFEDGTEAKKYFEELKED